MDKRFVLGARLGTLHCVFGLYGRVTVTTRGIVPAQVHSIPSRHILLCFISFISGWSLSYPNKAVCIWVCIRCYRKKTKFLFIAFVFDIEPTELTDFLSRYRVGISRYSNRGHFRLSRISPAAMKSSTASDILRYISSLHVLLYFLFFFSLHVVMVGP